MCHTDQTKHKTKKKTKKINGVVVASKSRAGNNKAYYNVQILHANLKMSTEKAKRQNEWKHKIIQYRERQQKQKKVKAART